MMMVIPPTRRQHILRAHHALSIRGANTYIVDDLVAGKAADESAPGYRKEAKSGLPCDGGTRPLKAVADSTNHWGR
jgi:hypothetical protein